MRVAACRRLNSVHLRRSICAQPAPPRFKDICVPRDAGAGARRDVCAARTAGSTRKEEEVRAAAHERRGSRARRARKISPRRQAVTLSGSDAPHESRQDLCARTPACALPQRDAVRMLTFEECSQPRSRGDARTRFSTHTALYQSGRRRLPARRYCYLHRCASR